jgi:hypothetical protein
VGIYGESCITSPSWHNTTYIPSAADTAIHQHRRCLHPEDIEYQKKEKATKLLQKRSISDCDVDSNRDAAIRCRQTSSESDISVCDKGICCILLCDVVQCCNDVCFGATHTFPSRRHMDRQESGEVSLTSHAFISVSFISSHLSFITTLVRSLISCSSSTLLMPAM